ncbi:hypothetical protein ACTMU2_40760 [Cupriavidus basilensis]
MAPSAFSRSGSRIPPPGGVILERAPGDRFGRRVVFLVSALATSAASTIGIGLVPWLCRHRHGRTGAARAAPTLARLLPGGGIALFDHLCGGGGARPGCSTVSGLVICCRRGHPDRHASQCLVIHLDAVGGRSAPLASRMAHRFPFGGGQSACCHTGCGLRSKNPASSSNREESSWP